MSTTRLDLMTPAKRVESKKTLIPGDVALTTNTLLSLGWTRHYIHKYLGDPDAVETFLYRRKRVTRFYYAQDRVDAALPLMLERKQAILNRAKSGKTGRDALYERFSRKYGTWADALPDACNSLFELNRYAKHSACKSSDTIYDLKNKIVKLLYSRGLCIECYLHTTTLPPKECFGCDGTGDHYDERCFKCGGTGIYLPAKTLVFVCFKFGIGKQAYCWHQPDHLIDFPYRTTSEPSSEYTVSAEEKPVSMSASEFTQAKHLLRWVIQKAPDAQEKKDVAA